MVVGRVVVVVLIVIRLVFGLYLVMVCLIMLEVLLVVFVVFIGMVCNCSLTPQRVLVETGVCTQLGIRSLQTKLVLHWDITHLYQPAKQRNRWGYFAVHSYCSSIPYT